MKRFDGKDGFTEPTRAVDTGKPARVQACRQELKVLIEPVPYEALVAEMGRKHFLTGTEVYNLMQEIDEPIKTKKAKDEPKGELP